METSVESERPASVDERLSLRVRLLGPLTIRRDGVDAGAAGLAQGARALGYLALAPHAVPRSQLCELLWDVPNDPRGELRWCLSKIRGILDEPGRRGSKRRGDTIGLDLGDCLVDAIEVARATQEGIETLAPERLRELCALVRRRISRRPGDRPQPGVQRLAHRAATPVPQLPCGAAGAAGRDAPRRRGVRLPREVARARAVRPPRPRDAARMPSRGAAGSAKARSIWRRPPACSKPKASIARRLRDAWRAAKARRERTARRGTARRSRPCDDPARRAATAAPRRASIAVMPFVDRLAAHGRARRRRRRARRTM